MPEFTAIPSEDYYQRFFRWMQLEAQAEAQRMAERRQLRTRKTAERTGETLLDLVIEEHQTGLNGRHLFTLVKRNRTLDLPWNRLRVGSPVLLTPLPDDNAKPHPGVVSARNFRSIQVAVDNWITGERFDVDMAVDEVSRNRERAALAAVSSAKGRLGELRQIILGSMDETNHRNRQPRFKPHAPIAEHEHPVADAPAAHLNASQQEAIRFALSAEDLAIIHGPPGTGKTTSVVEFIRQAVEEGSRILATAPSNTAVDNLLERLLAAGVRVVRLGHPARVTERLRDHTLDALVETHEHARWVKELYRTAEALFKKADSDSRSRNAYAAKQEWRREAKQHKADARRLERDIVADVLDSADVLCATTTIDEDLLGDRTFDWVVVDEACQSTESACWIPLQRANRVLLAGDHCQLPPTVLSKPAAAQGYDRSMMQRLVELYGPLITRQLTVQYRMHDHIMDFSSEQFYDGTLVGDETVRTRTLNELVGVEDTPFTQTPLEYIDTAGADYDERQEEDGLSRLNPEEGRLVLKKVDALIAAGLPAADIAVIAPYAAQVRWLRQHAEHRDLEIDTVDGFQGREKEAVVITLVRSNRQGEIGFLADTRRMNVALTRARRKLIVIGDSATLGANPFYAALLDYFQAHDTYHTVWEEMD
ncbi:AAA domain-containing protein [Lacipirellula sp.]|uniref:AAA domain-containing protein n=1 Tax=Lacipirellula sp. TaxID=2691419 RepID=UPI003D11DF22